jgi:predicted lipoprotein with Yx(FWY)xxD motif
MRIHARTTSAVVAAGLLATALSGCSDDGGSSSSSSTTGNISESASPRAAASNVLASPSASPGVATLATTSSPLGTILINGKKRTLYLFAKDTKSKSQCNGGCAQAWPPLTTTGATIAGGKIKTNLLGTTTRSDGKKQVTYHGHPLYTYSGDTGSGMANGQGLNAFGAKWYVVDTAGNKITKQPQSAGTGY